MFGLFISAFAEEAEEVKVLSAAEWITPAAVALCALVILCIALAGRRWSVRSICYGALCIALGFVLSYIKLFRMPSGGSVTLCCMLPILLFACAYGIGPGMLVGLVYGLLQYLQGGYFVHPVQFLLDYPLAFAMLGLAGIRFPKKLEFGGTVLAMLIAVLGRTLCATLAGYLFWGSAMWESLVYNASYLLPDAAICIIVAIPVAPMLLRMMKSGSGGKRSV